MKNIDVCLGVALILTSLGASAKEAAPNDMNKHYVGPAKKERRVASPTGVDQFSDWQPYLHWHRDAVSLQGSNDRRDAFGRIVPVTQL